MKSKVQSYKAGYWFVQYKDQWPTIMLIDYHGAIYVDNYLCAEPGDENYFKYKPLYQIEYDMTHPKENVLVDT